MIQYWGMSVRREEEKEKELGKSVTDGGGQDNAKARR